ncbi:hypothetical protein CDO73_17395 [Saccharibacillus sp. O23]|uniref:S-layer homology domain-containing protein n=1 Tax=Saccharibacillus sp. O23 TaxID=2009338 RepID=UPI000B4E27A8|nr:S-layer homology domain-containing protein [Saccharibacillus sp. O23]OWR28675.1 hypothetical protein CDO73_17395 [Saccharibacillus sp. O23]
MKTRTLKWVGAALAAVLTLGSISSVGEYATAASAGSSFSDVKTSHWAYGSVQKAVANGYVDGYTNGTFKPDASVSRAEFVKMAVAAMKLDVKDASGKWYVPYVDAATAKGLYESSDFANNEAAWNKTMTREEMARVAARAIGQTSKEDDKWMYLATKSGLIQGVGKGQVAPKGLTTRAQSVVIIDRILTANAGGKLSSDRYATAAAEILWHGTNIFTVMPDKFITPDSDWKNKGLSSIEEMWNEKNMTITSKDGLYQAKLDALVAIDMADPNDPNRGLLGDINTLNWYNGNKIGLEYVKNPIKNEKNTYVLYLKGGVIFNKDHSKYLNDPFVSYHFGGFRSPDETAFMNGKLNGATSIYRERDGDVPAFIVPKTRTVQGFGDITISLQTPSHAHFMEIDLLRMRGTR